MAGRPRAKKEKAKKAKPKKKLPALRAKPKAKAKAKPKKKAPLKWAPPSKKHLKSKHKKVKLKKPKLAPLEPTIRALIEAMGKEAVAKHFGVTPATIQRWTHSAPPTKREQILDGIMTATVKIAKARRSRSNSYEAMTELLEEARSISEVPDYEQFEQRRHGRRTNGIEHQKRFDGPLDHNMVESILTYCKHWNPTAKEGNWLATVACSELKRKKDYHEARDPFTRSRYAYETIIVNLHHDRQRLFAVEVVFPSGRWKTRARMIAALGKELRDAQENAALYWVHALYLYTFDFLGSNGV